jgi:hypothetical protein
LGHNEIHLLQNKPLGVLRFFIKTNAEKVPLNLIEVILAQGSTA